MAQSELPRPGVEVIQQLRTVSPTIVTPTLVPCIVGVCNQIIEVLNDDNTINSDALVSGPAVTTASIAGTYNLSGETLILSVNDGPNQTFTLPTGATTTAAQVVAAINGHTPAPVGFSASVYTVSSNNYVQLSTTGTGATRSIKFNGGTGFSLFAFAEGTDLTRARSDDWTHYGVGNYIQDAIYLPQTSLPDPRENMDELDVDETTVRMFLNLGTEVREILDTESFLRNGTTGTVTDDADGDATTPLVNLNGVNLLAAGTAAIMDGEVDLTTPVNIHNETLAVQLDGGGIQRVVFYGQPIVSSSASAGWTWGNIQSQTINLEINGVTHVITCSAGVSSLATLISEINTSVNAVFGFDIAYEAGSDGQVAASDYLGLFVGAAPPTYTPNTEVQVDANASTAHTEIFGVGTQINQMLVGDNAGSEPMPDIEGQIDAMFGTGFASIETSPAPSDHLRLTSSTAGTESKIEVNLIESTANVRTTLFNFGTDAEYTVTGGPFPARAGDAVYGDGTLLGEIVEIHPGGVQGRVKLNSEVSTSATYSTWYIIAKNLDTVATAQWGVSVPTPDFYVDTSGNINIKHDFLRDSAGDPVGTSVVGLYGSYTALRLDVTPDADSPGLLSFDEYDDLEDALAPVTPANPLAYGIYCAMQNSGDTSVTGIGVGDVSADKPNGTITGFTEAFDLLEANEVYGIAPMTSDSDIISVGQTHVNSMSAAANKGERVLIFHQGRPTREEPDIASSGTDGDRVDAGPPEVFDTKDPNLSASLQALGIDPASIAVTDGVYIDIASDNYRWNVTGAVGGGTQLTVNKTFADGENDDNFYEESATFPAVISETYSVFVRGDLITAKSAEISTIVARGEAWDDRRMWMLQFDQARATVDGVSQLVDGFYVAAAKSGMIAGYVPSTPFTNLAIAGFTGVTGSNDIYSRSQMDQGAAGGADWIIQEGAGAPLVSRHQLTTDLTSVETREQSIVKAVDYCAKFIRTGLRQYIGKFNITQSFIDTLAAVVQGQLRWLIENDVIAGADLNNILQDSDNPDTVLVDVTLEVLYPCNYIRVTLVV